MRREGRNGPSARRAPPRTEERVRATFGTVRGSDPSTARRRLWQTLCALAAPVKHWHVLVSSEHVFDQVPSLLCCSSASE
eukprot:3906883-Prymnesium_polylepis.1